jgi:hypothetical protein
MAKLRAQGKNNTEERQQLADIPTVSAEAEAALPNRKL